jgi:L-ascorbate metabolism protein UlaG (beta-lactamase superfamily)
MVLVRWWGHACFEVRNSVVIVSDPHDGRSVNMEPPRVSADIVLVSHGHGDHASGKNLVLKPEGIVLDKPGRYDVKGIKVIGLSTYHDEARGSKRGNNIVFVFEVEGIRFVHLGDLGHVLSNKEIEEMGAIDILMIPVGGYYTIDAKAATEIVAKVRPKIAIPMHYKVAGLTYPISVVEPFLEGKPNVKRLGRAENTYLKAQLPPPTEIDVFSLP